MEAVQFKDGNVETVRIMDVVAWTRGEKTGRLFLPPIQRSVVWRNVQIIHYWDSLLRGYPAGLMMVHGPRRDQRGGIARGRTAEGATCEVGDRDFHLFDGQQRLTTILLGCNAGQLHQQLKLWVDLGMESEADSDLLFPLRISSTGQPFGYQPDAPNQKASLGARKQKAETWRNQHGLARFDPERAFHTVTGTDLIGAVDALPLHQVISCLSEKSVESTVEALMNDHPALQRSRVESFVTAMAQALARPVIFQLIDDRVVAEEAEYIRYFGRLGQGGTALTDDELTYSIIKHQYPEVHDRVKEITEGPAGRLVGEVNLVLAALRVAKVENPWEGAPNWEIVGRPSPAFVSRLKQLPAVETAFRKMIPATTSGQLKALLEDIRRQLVYDRVKNPGGLPVMLLARLPHQLVDCLLLMAHQRSNHEKPPAEPAPLAPFVLYWLLFVSDYDKAATRLFTLHRESPCLADRTSLQGLIRDYEKAEIAHAMVPLEQLEKVRSAIDAGGSLLRSWSERFVELDEEGKIERGHALRIISTNRDIIKNVLLWLQRDDLAEQFGQFDPTSNRDEDLPIDLDHLIPHSKFGSDWRRQRAGLAFEDNDENFRWHRGTVGNSLGNFRWLDASENRARGARKLETILKEGDFVRSPELWNELIEESIWDARHVADFQKLIDLRTVDIYQTLFVEGQLKLIAPEDIPSRSLCLTEIYTPLLPRGWA